MANPWHHAVSSARKHGGVPEDYLPVHQWFDRSKRSFGDFRHRALYHHTEGIFDCEAHFGPTITLSTCAKCGRDHKIDGVLHSIAEDAQAGIEAHAFKPKLIPTRWIGEQHVIEDLGFIPHAAQYLERIAAEPWMNRSRRLSVELAATEERLPDLNAGVALALKGSGRLTDAGYENPRHYDTPGSARQEGDAA